MAKKMLFEEKGEIPQSKAERVLQKTLKNMLLNDGKGHGHENFAKLLDAFVVKLVDHTKNPNYTAAVSFDTGIIYISDGFLNRSLTFQLNVLIRHEMAHNILMHQIRMLHIFEQKYGKDLGDRISMSKSFHEIMNIIEDLEISNKVYVNNDKDIVRNMILNGRLISGLVTDDIRGPKTRKKDWTSLTVEQMYDALSEEIDNIHNDILQTWNWQENIGEVYENSSDFIEKSVRRELYWQDNTNKPTNFFGKLDKFINDKALYHFKPYDDFEVNPPKLCIVKYSTLPEPYQKIVKSIYDNFEGDIAKKNGVTFKKDDIRKLIKDIIKCGPLQKFDIVNPIIGDVVTTVYTPEEKLIAVDALKTIIPDLEAYQTWYDKVIKVLSDKSKYSEADIKKLFDKIDN